MKFKDKLVEERKSRGLSQEQLADKLGVSRQAISRWEAGNALPDVYNLKRISELFDISADYLLNDDCMQESDIKIVKNIQKNNERKLYRLSLFLILFGFIGIFILIILSSQIPAIEMKPYVVSDEAQINSDQSEINKVLYIQKKVYSFIPFLNYYNLNVIAAGLTIIMIGGIVLLIYVKMVLVRKNFAWVASKEEAVAQKKRSEDFVI